MGIAQPAIGRRQRGRRRPGSGPVSLSFKACGVRVVVGSGRARPDKGGAGMVGWGPGVLREVVVMTDIEGWCEPRFAAVREVLAGLLGTCDVGASAAVFLDGEPVVDLWGGYADVDRSAGGGATR